MWSKRNLICFSEKYGNLLFVGNTSTFLRLDDATFNQIQNYINKNEKLSEEIYNELVNIGAIVDSDEEILNKYIYKALSNSFMTNHMELWICLTNSCNFKCSYCYENEEPSFLDLDTIKQLESFIKKHKNIKSLTVYFYGGEPLLNIDGIFKLSEELSEIDGIEIKYQLITNG
ncbi:MAG: radical SAM protein, partial [Treponema sp.]|nr:radical SAM protein [Treponema sp.]